MAGVSAHYSDACDGQSCAGIPLYTIKKLADFVGSNRSTLRIDAKLRADIDGEANGVVIYNTTHTKRVLFTQQYAENFKSYWAERHKKRRGAPNGNKNWRGKA